MIKDTTIRDYTQPITVDDVRRWAEDMECDVTPVDRAWDIAAFALHLAGENEALCAQVAAHEDADRRWSADLRTVEADRDELRRDYADLIALDTDGLRSRIVAMEDAAEQHRMTLESVTTEAEEYRRWWQDAVAELTARNDAADVVEAAAERKRLEAMLNDAYRENEADRDAFDRALGAPVADLIAEYRHTIRQLTTRLNAALAAAEKAGAK